MTAAEKRVAHRVATVFGLLLAGLAALVARTGYYQILRGDEFARRARAQHYRTLEIAAPRGRIVDREGRILAGSYNAKTVAADPAEVEDCDLFASQVCLALGRPEEGARLSALLSEKRAEKKRFVYIERRVDREVGEALQRLDLPGLVVQEEPRRAYPHGRAAAALLGLLDVDGRGQSGLEARFEERLRGIPGRVDVLRPGRIDGTQFHLFPERAVPAEPGQDLRLTLDLRIQQAVEEALEELDARFRPATCCAIALDPANGEILAIAGRPALDPEAPRETLSLESLKVQAVQYAYEPGSTLKPLILAGALTAGTVRPGQVFDCGDGYVRFGRRLLHDVHSNGPLDLERILVKSSNTGMAQVGRTLGIRRAHDLLRGLGFGAPTGVPVAGEPNGRLTPLPKWHEDYTLVSVSMGHEILATPLQMALALAALANGGRYHPPRLLLDAPASPSRPLAFSREAVEFAIAAMEKVVLEGTGKGAAVRGVRVGGKTGTSEQLNAPPGSYDASFFGFAPVERPRIAVLVVASRPKRPDGGTPYGSVVAAPAVGKILARALPLRGVAPSSVERITPPGSGVRQTVNEGMLRVAAVHRSSVNAGEWLSPAQGRNPDSVGADCRRDER